MKCITKEEMKFDRYVIPARTLGRVIGKLKYKEANIPGEQLQIAFSLWDMCSDKNKGTPVSEVLIRNDNEDVVCGSTKSQMTGIVVHTDSTQVYLDAGDEYYSDATLTARKVGIIFDGNIPEGLNKDICSGRYALSSIINHLDEEFAGWVHNNCEFKQLTDEDIDTGNYLGSLEPGDTILTDLAMEQFEKKKLEYQNKLERIGFTYDFRGGLIWD